MELYFFDVRDSCGLTSDEVGVALENRQAAWIAAARILADLVEDAPSAEPADGSRTSVEVRDRFGSLGMVEMVFTSARADP